MKNKEIPSAYDFLWDYVDKNSMVDIHDAETAMIEYTNRHVQAALSSAAENAEISNKPKFKGDYNPIVDEDSIRNAYPESNIK